MQATRPMSETFTVFSAITSTWSVFHLRFLSEGTVSPVRSRICREHFWLGGPRAWEGSLPLTLILCSPVPGWEMRVTCIDTSPTDPLDDWPGDTPKTATGTLEGGMKKTGVERQGRMPGRAERRRGDASKQSKPVGEAFFSPNIILEIYINEISRNTSWELRINTSPRRSRKIITWRMDYIIHQSQKKSKHCQALTLGKTKTERKKIKTELNRNVFVLKRTGTADGKDEVN